LSPFKKELKKLHCSWLLGEINPDEKQDDIRSEAQNWLLEFKAR
jgi:hypothetical protein